MDLFKTLNAYKYHTSKQTLIFFYNSFTNGIKYNNFLFRNCMKKNPTKYAAIMEKVKEPHRLHRIACLQPSQRPRILREINYIPEFACQLNRI